MSVAKSGTWAFGLRLAGSTLVGMARVGPQCPAVTLGGFGPASDTAWACVRSPDPTLWLRGFPAAAVALRRGTGCALGGARALVSGGTRVMEGSRRFGGLLGGLLLPGEVPWWGLAASGSTAVVGGMRLPTASEV